LRCVAEVSRSKLLRTLSSSTQCELDEVEELDINCEDLLDKGKSLANIILDTSIPCVQNAFEAGVTVAVNLDNCELGKRFGFLQRTASTWNFHYAGISTSSIFKQRKRQTAWMARIDLGGCGRSGLIVLIGPEDAYVDMSDIESPMQPLTRKSHSQGSLFEVKHFQHNESEWISSNSTLVDGNDATMKNDVPILSRPQYPYFGWTTSTSTSSKCARAISHNVSRTSFRRGSTSEFPWLQTADTANTIAKSVARRSMLLLADTAEQMGIALQQAMQSEQEKQKSMQLKEKNEALMQARKEVKVAQAHKDFTAVMSHELRTPLFAISSLSTMILEMPIMQSDESKSQDAANYLNLIKQSAEMLITIVNNILDFAKYEDNDFTLDKTVFSLRSACEMAIDIATFQNHTNSHPLIMTFFGDHMPDFVVGDETRFRQILINLVANACKFTGSNGDVEIHVNIDEDEQAKIPGTVRIKVAVRDTGIGIKPEDEEKLFQRFAQGDASITRKYGGTGLGLSIAKNLCRLMGGDIKARTNLYSPLGTEFLFSVVLDEFVPDEWNEIQLPVSVESLRLAESDSKEISVALIDSNSKTVAEFELLMRTCGINKLRHFPTIAEALNASQTTPFTVIALDYHTIVTNNELTEFQSLTRNEINPHLLVLCDSHYQREHRKMRAQGDQTTLLTRPPKLHLVAEFLRSVKPNSGSLRKTPMSDNVLCISSTFSSTDSDSQELLPTIGSPMKSRSLKPRVPTSDEFYPISISTEPTSTSLNTPVKVPLLVPSSPTATVRYIPTPPLGNILPKYNILVVEDNKINQLVIGKMLAKLGQQFDFADDGVYAMERLFQNAFINTYDVLFMDIMMPRKDGYQTTQEIRESTKNGVRPWIVGLSANAFWEDKLRAVDVNPALWKT
ncbi:hypothetical protein HDU76_005595, partial [Blyttiomyces sp. JEL0837]